MAGETAPSINGIYYFATCPFTAFPNLLCELNHQDHGFGLRVLSSAFLAASLKIFRQLLSGLDMYAIFLVLSCGWLYGFLFLVFRVEWFLGVYFDVLVVILSSLEKSEESLRDPCTNSMSKFYSSVDNVNWETNSSNGISLGFIDSYQQDSYGKSHALRPKAGLYGQREDYTDDYEFSCGLGKSKLNLYENSGVLEVLALLLRLYRLKDWGMMDHMRERSLRINHLDSDDLALYEHRSLKHNGSEIIAHSETPRSLSQKFRPKSFDELVGQNVVARSLLGAISRGRLCSFYLHGPRGTGKTSASRIFAAALNCLSLESIGHVVCAGNVVRLLIKNALIPPASSRFKVFIVDECHLLHGETWATVLTSLDNLSQHVIFVMITPYLDKLPGALARCQRYHFPKIRDADIARRLGRICVEEGLDFDQAALDFIAAKSNGSLRDAEMMLDQLSLLGRKITMSLAYELIGIVSDDELLDLLEMALSSDTSNTVLRARELMSSRIDPMQLISQLANLVMDILVGKGQEGSSEVRRKFSSRHSWESWKHLVSCSREDIKLHKLGMQEDCKRPLESIWKRATELCQPTSLKNFLQKQGKLSSLFVSQGQGLALAELEFCHPEYISKAEKSWKLIVNSLQSTLGCNVENGGVRTLRNDEGNVPRTSTSSHRSLGDYMPNSGLCFRNPRISQTVFKILRLQKKLRSSETTPPHNELSSSIPRKSCSEKLTGANGSSVVCSCSNNYTNST
ncbi:hypothetical protein FNV43_RR19425 [Rhamnella rubrinervis]|uniref:AAA+ ATPase domain-containing protein n=1 Tax=Rhamnella rubrinervis TaxID=2594499 RepID=A0A8K0GTP2_9ROSA|nr:hypothetical protein FNV43_RR19425 [Rhamnella rubrinervis]